MKSSLASFVEEQFDELKSKYKHLELISHSQDQFSIRGPLRFCATYGKKEIKDSFEIEIVLPEDYPRSPPRVREVKNRIPKDFHKIQDDFLCLATPLEVRLKFFRERSLLAFVDELVIHYLYSFCCWEKNKEMPYGERSHGVLGILEQYRDMFCLDSNLKVFSLIKILAEDSYRGHLKCPCGSGKILRKCHGPVLLEIKNLKSQKGFFFEYLDLIGLLYGKDESLPKCLSSKKILSLLDKFYYNGKRKSKQEASVVLQRKKVS